ncbi:hypothetical protein CALVIDRAFT_543565 [Calocera viscosa TUFC12733]|uniref:Uncharacterized protein n=1 Tax=Calocera viscosa (strain TUFC12733) TaxID=1330018 RepID=A0A167FE85_CALVF|nr:hypothetical protein CALVIDRAFT_543565 [Calocera viscosa TUFC12733]
MRVPSVMKHSAAPGPPNSNHKALLFDESLYNNYIEEDRSPPTLGRFWTAGIVMWRIRRSSVTVAGGRRRSLQA